LREELAAGKAAWREQSAKPTELAPVPRHEAKGFVAFGLDLPSPQG